MFSSRLRNLRTQRGITQAELASSIGVSSGTITMWETGKREPKFDKLSLIASFFECSIDYLLGHVDNVSTVQSIDNESWHPLGEACQNSILMYLRLDGVGKNRADTVIHNEFRRCEQTGKLKSKEDFSLTIFRK